MSAQVRQITTDELPRLMAGGLGGSFYGEGAIPGKLVPAVFIQTWTGLLKAANASIFVLEDDQRMIGALGAIIYPDPNDGDLVATEMFWYVAPENRGGGLQLLTAYEKWATGRGASRLVMVHLHDLFPDALRKLYQRRGYLPAETHYIKEVS